MNNIKSFAASIPALAIYRSNNSYPDHESLPRILTKAGIGIWSMGVSSNNFCCCPLTKQMLGISSGDIIGLREILKLLNPACLRKVYYTFYVGFHSNNPIALEIPLETKQDTTGEKWVFLTGLFDPCLREFRGIAYDITDRKNLENKTAMLVAKLSHELRSPLSAIKLYTQKSISLIKPKHPDIGTLLEKADHQINRINNLIDDFLLIAVADNQRLTLKKTFFYLKDMINEVLNECFSGLYNERVIIYIQEKESIYGDRGKLIQVLTNYISNAAKYSPAGSEIIISSARMQGELTVSVQDFGVGISSLDREKLFQKFYRCSNVTGISGYGIGLFIVKEIIEAHNGSVGISSGIGEGSTFFFTLPQKMKNKDNS